MGHKFVIVGNICKTILDRENETIETGKNVHEADQFKLLNPRKLNLKMSISSAKHIKKSLSVAVYNHYKRLMDANKIKSNSKLRYLRV